MSHPILNLKRTPEEYESVNDDRMPPVPRRKFWQIRKGKIIFVVLVVLLLWGATCYLSSRNTWRAVFLANNQVYFGHLRHAPFSQTARLTDVYYLQVNQLQPQAGNPNISLIKLGNELHGPKDGMTIPMNQILFWEDLKNDGQVVQTIKQLEGQK